MTYDSFTRPVEKDGLGPRSGPLKPFALVIDTQRGLLKNGYKFYATKAVD